WSWPCAPAQSWAMTTWMAAKQRRMKHHESPGYPPHPAAVTDGPAAPAGAEAPAQIRPSAEPAEHGSAYPGDAAVTVYCQYWRAGCVCAGYLYALLRHSAGTGQPG